MVIDAHNHPDWHGHDLSRFLANMDEYGIDQAWLLTWESPVDEYDPHFNCACSGGVLSAPAGPIPFSRCLSYKERAPDRFVLGFAPDPRRPDAIDRLRSGVEIYGVQVCGELKLRMMYDNPDALRMFWFCGERHLPVTVHIDYEFDNGRGYPRANYWYGGGIEPFARALRACPETIFVGHAPGFWAHISGDDKYDKVPYPEGPVLDGGRVPALLRECDNLYADISAGSGLYALSRDPAFGREFVLEFQDRLLFARDCFDGRQREFLDSLELPESVLEKLLGGNAVALLAPQQA